MSLLMVFQVFMHGGLCCCVLTVIHNGGIGIDFGCIAACVVGIQKSLAAMLVFWMGMSHGSSEGLCCPCKMSSLFFAMRNFSLVKMTLQLSLHNCPMESSDVPFRLGRIMAC